MAAPNDWYRYAQQLYAQQVWQTKKLNDLDQMIRRLQTELNGLKQQKPINVERIEYKFDQLKVERLEGTLNVGMTPNVSEAIEDFTVNGQTGTEPPLSPEQEQVIRRVRHEIYRYLGQEVHDFISRMEKKYNHALDYNTRQRIIAELGRQIEDRARTYVNHMKMDVTGDQLPDSEQMVIEKMKQDIGIAVENYLKRVTGAN
jgi:spore germination protein PC